jgi:tRNA pseudouridine55 synthase
VVIHELDYAWCGPDSLAIRLRCSKGTYVRALARDLGEALDCGAHLSRLVRTAVAELTLERAIGLDELRVAAEGGRLAEILLPVDDAFGGLAALVAEPRAARAMQHGATWRAASAAAGAEARDYTGAGELLGLAASQGEGEWRPRLALEVA